MEPARRNGFASTEVGDGAGHRKERGEQYRTASPERWPSAVSRYCFVRGFDTGAEGWIAACNRSGTGDAVRIMGRFVDDSFLQDCLADHGEISLQPDSDAVAPTDIDSCEGTTSGEALPAIDRTD
jgi:hypothetical protein